jgi:ABC-2 type transport system ATP-binding protein
MEAVFQQCIREVKAEGRTVLLSSHILGEAEALCHRVSIIRSGRIVRTGSLADLRAESTSTIQCTTPEPVPALVALPGVTVTAEQPEESGVRTVARVSPDDLIAAVEAVTAARPVAMTVEPPSLDELFLDHYRRGDAADGQDAVASGATP